MRIGITNTVLSNSGDAAIYQGIVSSIKASFPDHANIEFVAFDSNSKVTSALYPEWTIYQQITTRPTFRPWRVWFIWEKLRVSAIASFVRRPQVLKFLAKASFLRQTAFGSALTAMLDCDLIISSGGTYLVDHYYVKPREIEVALAKTLGKPVFMWTQSLGPFRNPRTALSARSIARDITGIYFRDERSARAWKRIDATAAGKVVPDVVFALDAASVQADHSRNSATSQGKQRPRAIFSVRKWNRGVEADDYDPSAYIGMMRAGAEELLKENWDVEALSTCQGVPQYAFDDSAVAKEAFRGTGVKISTEFHSPDQLLTELQRADLVVTTRMHLAILALIAGRPVIAVAYEFKTLELFRSLGLGDFVTTIEASNEDWIAERISAVTADPQIARLSDSKIKELRARALTPAEDLCRFLYVPSNESEDGIG